MAIQFLANCIVLDKLLDESSIISLNTEYTYILLILSSIGQVHTMTDQYPTAITRVGHGNHYTLNFLFFLHLRVNVTLKDTTHFDSLCSQNTFWYSQAFDWGTFVTSFMLVLTLSSHIMKKVGVLSLSNVLWSVITALIRKTTSNLVYTISLRL